LQRHLSRLLIPFVALAGGSDYDAVEPDRRVIATELKHGWNLRLLAVQALEDVWDAHTPELRNFAFQA
jgi:hypothetical protein